MTPRLRAIGITRQFGGVTALQDVAIDLHDGRIHCVLGGNGAGKSTLIRILSGNDRPTSGEIRVLDVPQRFASPRDARKAGIAVVHQELALVPLMSVWRNFVLGHEPRKSFAALDVAAARSATERALDQFNIRVEIDRPVSNLSGGERQILAIARAIHFGGRVLILDEPTAALSVEQAARTLNAIRNARAHGIAVLLITHNPHHALEVGDDVTLLRRGKVISHRRADELSEAELTELISQ